MARIAVMRVLRLAVVGTLGMGLIWGVGLLCMLLALGTESLVLYVFVTTIYAAAVCGTVMWAAEPSYPPRSLRVRWASVAGFVVGVAGTLGSFVPPINEAFVAVRLMASEPGEVILALPVALSFGAAGAVAGLAQRSWPVALLAPATAIVGGVALVELSTPVELPWLWELPVRGGLAGLGVGVGVGVVSAISDVCRGVRQWIGERP